MLFPKSQPKGDLVTVCFGANDAAMAGIPQHVPLQEFSANMAAVLDWLHECFHRVIVLTCPPVDEKRRLEYQVEKYGSKATGVLERTNERAQMYAAAAATTARKANAPVIDLWSGMQEEAVGSRPWLLPPPARHSPAGAVLPRCAATVLAAQQDPTRGRGREHVLVLSHSEHAMFGGTSAARAAGLANPALRRAPFHPAWPAVCVCAAGRAPDFHRRPCRAGRFPAPQRHC